MAEKQALRERPPTEISFDRIPGMYLLYNKFVFAIGNDSLTFAVVKK
jgi:hypothetical protein